MEWTNGAAAREARAADRTVRRVVEERRRIRRRRKLRLKAALLGRSRGGQTSKVHLAADRKCRPLAFILTTGQAADSPQFIPVLKRVRVRGPVGRPRIRPDAVAGDKVFSSRGNRAHLRKRCIKADKIPDSYLAGLHLRASMIWIKHLTRTTR